MMEPSDGMEVWLSEPEPEPEPEPELGAARPRHEPQPEPEPEPEPAAAAAEPVVGQLMRGPVATRSGPARASQSIELPLGPAALHGYARGEGYVAVERQGLVSDTWEVLYLRVVPDGRRHIGVYASHDSAELLEELHLPESRVSLPLKSRAGRADSTFCLESWSSGFPGPRVDIDSPRLTSISKADGAIHCGLSDDGWRRGLFELGITRIQLRDNKNPLALFVHTIEYLLQPIQNVTKSINLPLFWA